MRPTPPGGIMDVGAQPLSKNATWQGENKEEATVSSEAEQNKTLVRRLFEARGKLDLDALDKMLAPHFLSHTTRVLPGQQLDWEGYKRTSSKATNTLVLGGDRCSPTSRSKDKNRPSPLA
jgi:hypothetical protein